MGSRKTSYAVMFADVSGSSRLYQEIGNDAAKATIDLMIQRMVTATERHGGRVIKTIGDEVMACFKTCEEALDAATTMQRAGSDKAASSPKLRIGIDFGEVLVENQDLFGQAVNDAAYVSHVARGGQVIITDNVYQSLPVYLQKSCRAYDRVVLKGNVKILVHSVLWEQTDDSMQVGRTVSHGLPEITRRMGGAILQLDYAGQRKQAHSGDTPFSIGRSVERALLVVSSPLASREHCQVLHRRGKFILADHSTNGTYVKLDGHGEIYLRREELPLAGAGSISLGQALAEVGQHLIRFAVISN